MSFVLQQFVLFILPKLIPGYGGPNAQQPMVLVQPKTQFTIFGVAISNITIVIIVVRAGAGPAHRHRDQPHEVRPRHPGRRPGPDHRDADGRVAGARSS